MTVFFGPIVGAIIYVGIYYLASLFVPDRWPLIVGLLFVVAVVFMKQGVGPFAEGVDKGAARSRRPHASSESGGSLEGREADRLTSAGLPAVKTCHVRCRAGARGWR